MEEIKVFWNISKYDADATEVYNEITSLGDEVRPAEILDYARNNPDSELHKCFTWDNTEAAEKYRLYEARQVVLNLKFTYSNEGTEQTVTRVLLRTEPTGGYKQVIKIVQDIDEYSKMLQMAIGELKAFERKYSSLAELSEVMELIRAL